ncbi:MULTISPECIES: TetR/AcrR family transcriptional regulator [Streptomyces]|jgi:AcrR family transcriptional regulator|uniref:TetR/AcrR family transcriptional regulator n=1 Tax=Streptomyces TaxID=1883 RepID=UPI0004CC5AB6|nr:MULTISPECIES: TetR/AcrR family transcriptional regulator [Streptomyces]KOU43360.1 TetR-family transcriptional regulator [Streptomyces sp. WM6373]KOU72689.1 TetR-family transcriptional regulator [Streptomyces sp. XY66]KOU76366.1 TetR-family transcriptional regulator [Streptomyces sp. IGB124]KOU91120.1 TetR-family transcriptional regulator [Streptomyces sp. XY58]KOV12899.1 TetR-family transcriptional regulator [Streptomyces sp. XY37]
MSTPPSAPTADRRTLIADTAIGLVAAAGLRGLTHRAVDAAAGLPAGSTSYYFRTRTALIGACYQRLAELDLADVDDGSPPGAGLPALAGAAPDREAAAAALAGLLYRWLTVGRERQLARFELSLEAARNPDLEADFHRAGQGARSRAAGIVAALGSQRPQETAELLVAWTEGLLYDRLAGALARSRPAPDLAELTAVARRMLAAALTDPA